MKGGKVIHDPRKAVLRRLAESYDELAEIEQELVADGYYDDAEVAHDQAVRVLTAYNAESRGSGYPEDGL